MCSLRSATHLIIARLKALNTKKPWISPRLIAVWTRLELATPCVTGMYSNQLNYQTSFGLGSLSGGAKIRYPFPLCNVLI
jgi:hypothetical protein